MVIIKYAGRFGNNIFQYSLGRIIAEEKGLQLLPYGGQYSHELNTELIKGNIYSPDQIINESTNIQNILCDNRNIGYTLDGYFQKAEYYIPNKDRIREWIKFNKIVDFEPNKDDIAIHIRISDFGCECNVGMLPLSFYTNIINNLKFNKLYIFGGCSHNREQMDIDNEVIETFEKYKPIYPNLDAITEFQMLMKFRRIIQSTSTFCWWSSFLSENAEEIYTPITKGGYWELPRKPRPLAAGMNWQNNKKSA